MGGRDYMNRNMDRNLDGKKWIYLPVEIKVRELDAKLLLAYYAVKENYRVIIGEHRIVEIASVYYPNGIFFSKGYPNHYRKRVISNAKKEDHILVELDEEGLIIYDESKYLTERMNVEFLEDIEQEYCWGNFQKEMIGTAYPQCKKNCYITGHPRFDLLNKKFRSLYNDSVLRLQNKYGDFILINTRFTNYNHFSGMKNENLEPNTAYIKDLYYSFIRMIKDLAEKYPSLNFVIRPHPGENLTSYQKAFSRNSNIFVIREGNVVNWILASNLIIHNGCTTGIEAFLLEKPVLTYLPIESKDFDVDLPNKMSFKAYSVSEVFDFIDYITSNRFIHNVEYEQHVRNNENFLSNYYGGLDDEHAYEKIIRLLNKLRIKNESFSLGEIDFSIGKKNKIKYRFDSLTIKEIQTFFTKIDQIEKTINKVSIRKLAENLFEISAL